MSGRFDERATKPGRGPKDMLAWKVARRSDPRPENFTELDAVRPGVADAAVAAAALASGEPCAVWIGHATWAMRLGGKLIVTDPVWSKALSGVVKRLVPVGLMLEEMPAVDVVLLTHDHRDHMDLPTLAKLPPEATYVVPLGNGARLKGKAKVVELDWWQTESVGGLEVTLVPARHWAMRMPWNRNDTLWGGYVVRSKDGVAYHSGDTAWGDHFEEIGKRFAGIDWAMLPIGAYSPRWFMEPQHMNPEEAGRGFEAVGARNLLAMHWGTFRLTDEAVGEPVERIRKYWVERGLDPSRLWVCDVGEVRALRR